MKIFDYADLGNKKSWDYSIKGITPEEEGIKPIIKTDEVINMGDVLIINNIAYTVCCLSGKANKYNVAYVEQLKEQGIFINSEEAGDKDYTQEITCPFCGFEDENSWEADDEEDEYECPCCGSTFSYQRNITVEYCSQPVRKGEVVYLN